MTDGYAQTAAAVEAEKLRSKLHALEKECDDTRAKLQELEADKSEKDEPLKEFYDLVVKVDSFQSILEEGWEVQTRLDSINMSGEEDKSIRFSILGDFKKGKTWLLSRLCGKHLPADAVVHTPGLCWKRLTINKVQCLLMDSKGEDSPVTKIDNTSLNDKRIEEIILRDIVCQMADSFIFLVNSLGSHEQEKLQALCGQLALTSPHTEVYVVHNLKHIVTKEKFDEAVKEIAECHGQQGFYQNEVEVHSGSSRTVDIPVFDKQLSEEDRQHTVRQVHFVLGCEGAASGEANDFVIKHIKDRLLTTSDAPHKKTIVEELKDTIKETVIKYLYSPTQLIPSAELQVYQNTNGNEMIKVKVDADDVKPRPGFITAFVPTLGSGNAGVPYRITRVYSKEEDLNTSPDHSGTSREVVREKILVQLKLPGYTKEELDSDLSGERENPVITLEPRSGKLAGYTITVRSDRIVDNIATKTQNIIEQDCKFTTSNKLPYNFDVPHDVSLKDVESACSNGIVELLFDKKRKRPRVVKIGQK